MTWMMAVLRCTRKPKVEKSIRRFLIEIDANFLKIKQFRAKAEFSGVARSRSGAKTSRV